MGIIYPHFSLQCSWLKRLYDNSSHPWKIIIPFYLIDTYLEKNLKFHSNLSIPANKIKRFPVCYYQIFNRRSENLSSFPNLPLSIASHVIWYSNVSKLTTKSYTILERHEKIQITLDSFSNTMVNPNYGKN